MEKSKTAHEPVHMPGEAIILDASKIRFFRRSLLAWFRQEGRRFPWRAVSCDPYQIAIGEILLQRTRAEVVAKFFPQFINKYPSWESLAVADEQQLEEFLKPIGLWQRRTTALKSLTNAIVGRGAQLPGTRDSLESLPAVGQYIANAILTMCYGKREPLLDVNMARLLERFFGPRRLADIRYDPYLQKLSREVLSRGRARDLNWAMLDFAAIVCRARSPAHNVCPLALKCSYYFKTVENVT